MKKSFYSRILAILLCAALLGTLFGCAKEEKTWIAKDGDFSMPIGTYVYFLYNAYAEVEQAIKAKLMDGETYDVLTATYQGMSGAEYIRQKAEHEVRAYFALRKELKDRGLSMTKDEIAYAESLTDAYWEDFGASVRAFSIGRDSFAYGYSYDMFMSNKLFGVLYNLGGEQEISDEALKAYYCEKYTSYDMITVKIRQLDDKGQTYVPTAQEKAALQEQLNAYAERVRTGKSTMTDVYLEMLTDVESEDITRDIQVADIRENYLTSMQALRKMQDGDVGIASFNVEHYLIFRQDIEESAAEMLGDADSRLKMLHEMMQEEYTAFLYETGDALTDFTFNTKAAESIALEMFKVAG